MTIALVTGAARGIGKTVAERLTADGWRVAMLDRTAAEIDAAAASVPGAVPLAVDISDEAAVEAALASLGEAVGVVVNNAGIVRFGPLLDLATDDFRAVVDVNLVGTFIVSRAAARAMAASGGGAIVNITSMNGVAPGPNAGAYGATKAGIALLTQQMAVEWGRYGIRVNCVAPGLINAGMSEPIFADSAVREARQSKVPLGRLGSGEDIASAVSFLASDQASYITGQNLLVDGGVTMSIIANLPRPESVDSVGMQS
ncbi:MAG: SDR family NAD(P)-dependent oxidoreductase [Actinomycetota bacterium]|nr:SDR family NAD(P)-dependent oxidoreductase [Actinomycetota bacterium]